MIEIIPWEDRCYTIMVNTAMAALCMDDQERGFFEQAYPTNTSLMELTPKFDLEAGELKRLDRCYVAISPTIGEDRQGVLTQYTAAGVDLIRLIPFTAKFAFYGDEATALCSALKGQMERNAPIIYKNREYENPVDVLRRGGIVKNKEQKNIVSLPELYQGDWIKRADFDFTGTMEIKTSHQLAAIEQMGDLTIRSDKIND